MKGVIVLEKTYSMNDEINQASIFRDIMLY
jgi:hypothetical protein